MSLMQQCYKTYEVHSVLAGEVIEGQRSVLLPVSHIMQRAQIEITLDKDGNFVEAKEVPKEDSKTIIPATESSAGRTSGAVAHPLCDQVEYVSNSSPAKHKLYLKQLTDWAESDFSHPKVMAVLRYVQKETVLQDLAKCDCVKLTEDGFLEKGKISGIDYHKCLIRWRILESPPADACWEDTSLFRSYADWYSFKQADAHANFCMISGATLPITDIHPRGLVVVPNGAKLISANDNSGFTYRGRFTDSEQALTISYLASQKAHNALQWVIANHGVMIGGRTFVCWSPEGYRVPQPMDPLLSSGDEPADPSEYRNRVFTTLLGYRNELPENAGVVVASFDAATTGRLSLTYYSELAGSGFLDRIENWYATCCWEYGRYGCQSPALDRIALCAFGVERGQFLDLDDRVRREHVQRLFSCVVDGAAVPYDIVKALTQRASMPLSYESKNRMTVLCTACAVIRKYYNDKLGREEWSMALEPHKKDRSYQYGRLLAVMEMVERRTYSRDETREPNAIRMQTIFCERPMYAVNIINRKLEPYFAKLKPATRGYYKRLISEIMQELSELIDDKDSRLGDTYLMGYYLQRAELYRPANNKNDKNNDNESEEE